MADKKHQKHPFHAGYLIVVGIVLVLAVLIVFGPRMNMYGQAVYFDSQSSVVTGDELVLSIMVSDVTDLYAADLAVTYDSDLLQFVSAGEGTFLNQDGAGTFFSPDMIDTSNLGLLNTIVLTRLGDVGGVSGTGKLVELRFIAIDVGTSNLTFPKVELLDINGAPVNPNGIQSSVVVIKSSDVTPPAVYLDSPTEGQELRGTTTLQATAMDNDHLVGVQFLLNGANLGAEDLTAPYEMSWDTTKYPDGQYTLSAFARDAAGNTAETPGTTVTVRNTQVGDVTDPVVAITEPIDGSEVKKVVTITSIASDDTGIVGIQYFVDGELFGSEGTGSPYSVNWNTKKEPVGDHIISVLARDAAGNTATDAVVVTIAGEEGSNLPPGLQKKK